MKQEESTSLKARISKFIRPAGRWAIYLGVFLVLRYTGVLGSVRTVAQSALFQTGVMDASPSNTPDAAPMKFDYNFTLYNTDGNKVDVSSLKGKVLFVNLWATWCGPCRVEMPSIQNLYNTVNKDDVAFIMLALDQKDPFNKVKQYVAQQQYTFPVYFPASTLPEILQVRSIPATFIVNREGNVVHKQVGTANYDTEEFRNFLKNL